MKHYLKFLILLGFLFFYSCETCKAQSKRQAERQAEKDAENEKIALDSWLNSDKAELIRSWGAPTRYDSDGQGGEILIYENSRTVGAVIGNNYLQRTIINYKEIFVNNKGIIYYWRTGRR